MSLTFSQYKNAKNSQDFMAKYDALCEAIVINDVDFYEFWSESILPILETSQSRDENELLDAILMEGIARRSFRNVLGDLGGGLGRFATGVLGGAAGLGADVIQGAGEGIYDATKRTLGGFGQGFRGVRGFDPKALGGSGKENTSGAETSTDSSAAATSSPPPMPAAATSSPPPMPAAATSPKTPEEIAKEKKLAIMQNRVNQQVDGVKRKFSMAMRDFLKNTSDEAKMQNDPILWQIANKFSEKISDTANKYSLNATFNGADKNKFNQQRQAMMANKQAALKQQLKDKFGSRNTVRGGNTPVSTPPTNPEFKQMMPGGPSGFQSKENTDNGNNMLIESLIRCTGSRK